jgi:predicted acetyltransferase
MTNDRAEAEQIEVVPAAKADEPIIANLLELYAHDFSEFYGVELGPDGRFGYKSLPLYWIESGRHPFLVRIGSKLAGFVLVKRGSEVSGQENVWDMAEFFVARGYRRRGAGTKVTHEIWKRFPGAWEVRVVPENTSARHFWSHAISTFTGDAIHSVGVEKDGERWTLFRFESAVAV